MIVLEWLYAAIWWFARFVVWLMTARDCEHCQWRKMGAFSPFCSNPEVDTSDECLDTIRRVYFVRKKKE